MRRNPWQHAILSLLCIGIALLLVWLTSRLEPSFDVTSNARHSLNPESVRAADALEGPVEVIAVLGPDPEARAALSTLVARYQAFKPDIELRTINSETNPTEARELQAAAGGELILRTADREQRLQTLSERTFTGALRQLGRQAERTIAFVTGHGERTPVEQTNDDWSLVAERLASIGLKTRELSLVSTPVPPDDIDVLVVAGPSGGWFPGELQALSTWMAKGGNLLWLVDTPFSDDSSGGFDTIGLQLGVDRLPGQVIDVQSQKMDFGAPDFVVLDAFPENPITLSLASPVLLPGASAFAITPLAGQTVTPLLQTPDASWTETGELNGAVRFDAGGDETEGPLLLGMTIERDVRRQPGGESQRIAIVGDADFGSSQFLGNGGNQMFAESLMLWLTGDSNESDFTPVAAKDAGIALGRRSIIGLTATLLAGLPLTFLIVAGVVAWRRRH